MMKRQTGGTSGGPEDDPRPDGEPVPAVRERFLILAREPGAMAEQLRAVLAPLGKVEVIVDRAAPLGQDGSYLFYPDDEVAGHEGLMSQSSPFPPLTAWSRAMYHLAKTLEDDEAVWFVEDDVAGNAACFEALVRETAGTGADLAAIDIRSRKQDPGWNLWNYAEPWFPQPWRAFKPLSRKSARLIRAALEFRERHGCFAFHEVLFPTLAIEQGMKCLDWRLSRGFWRLFGCFRFRPAVSSLQAGVSHPVKDAAIHGKICGFDEAVRNEEVTGEFPRLPLAGCKGWSIFSEDYGFLSRYCRRHGFGRVMEFGPGDSTLAFLDAGCRVHSFECDREWLDWHRLRFASEREASLEYCGEEETPAADSLAFRPDLVFVDGPPFRQGQQMSRLGACEWALDICGHFILHDAKRTGEQATLAELKQRGMHVEEVPTRKGLAIVTDPGRRPELLAPSHHRDGARYRGEDDNGWWATCFTMWSIFFATDQPVKALDVGAGPGAGANLLLDHLFTAAESEVHCIEDFMAWQEAGDGMREDFLANARESGHESRLDLYEGCSTEILAWMISTDGYWESFDFIHLAGTQPPSGQLAAACQAWSLLKPGGILVFGRRGPATNGFSDAFRGEFTVLFEGDAVALCKLVRPPADLVASRPPAVAAKDLHFPLTTP